MLAFVKEAVELGFKGKLIFAGVTAAASTVAGVAAAVTYNRTLEMETRIEAGRQHVNAVTGFINNHFPKGKGKRNTAVDNVSDDTIDDEYVRNHC